jgi:hypothetical protein
VTPKYIEEVLNSTVQMPGQDDRQLGGLSVHYRVTASENRDEFSVGMFFDRHEIWETINREVWRLACQSGNAAAVNLIIDVDRKLRDRMVRKLTGSS